ncbi:MAG TPA: hypothetical protein VK932_27895 [Kofleriaceae bacterium]|nr:hypothetical protein [Kofleriaceae bacterium]
MERLAALEAEVKADGDAQRARKEAALAKVREQRAEQQAERDAIRARQAELVTRRKPARDEDEDDGGGGGIADALALAKRAHGMKQELTRAPKAGEKSLVKSGLASMLLGPLGWLYAGSMREAIPASAAWLAFAALASKIIPMFLLMPVLLVALPLSGLAGVVYAMQYNKAGSRQRLFDKDKGKDRSKKQLSGGD